MKSQSISLGCIFFVVCTSVYCSAEIPGMCSNTDVLCPGVIRWKCHAGKYLTFEILAQYSAN